MRILAVDLGPERRGGQQQTLALTRELARRGHEVWVAARAGSPLAADVAAAGGLGLVPVSGGSEASPLVLLDLARAARRLRPDVVYAGEARAHGAVVWSRAARRRPFAVHRRYLAPPRRNPLSWIKYALVDRFFAVSGVVRTALLEGGIPPDRVVVVEDGLPPGSEVEAPWPEEPPYRLAHVGAFDGQKGQEVVVAVVERLAAEGLDVSATFLGEGPERPRIEAAARSGPAAARFTFAGSVPDVPRRLAASHLLVQPSRAEAGGLVLVEAMAAGCPVAVAEVGGTREVLDDGRAGRLVASSDPAAWTGAVRDLLLAPGERRRLQAEGRALAARRTIGATADAVERELTALLRDAG